MNNKILLAIIVLIAVFGAFVFLGNKKPADQTAIQPTAVQEPTKEATTPDEQIVTILLTDSGFAPKEVTVKAGTRMIWVNKSGQAASLNSSDHPAHKLYPFLNLGEFADGSSVQAVAEKAGKYTYHDHYNATSTGTITVE